MFMKPIQLLAGSEGLEPHLDAKLPIGSAPGMLIQADQIDGSPQPTLALLGPESEPTYHVVLAPKRGSRPTGANSSYDDPLGIDVVRQRGQSFFLYSILETLILLLANPFPYAKDCATWAFLGVQMVRQLAGSRDQQCLRKLFHVMFTLSEQMPHAIFGFNAVAGNSLERLHFVSHTPALEIGLYAVQRLAADMQARQRSPVCVLGPGNGYPLEVVRFGSQPWSGSVDAAVAFVARLHALGEQWTFNAAVAVEEGLPVLYVAPRDSSLRPAGWPAQFGFMEILGVAVASDLTIVERVRDNTFTHGDWVRALSSLRLPSVRHLV